MHNDAADKRRGSISSPAFVSVCSQFKSQLTELIQKIKETSPHYVRCIKPNDQNAPGIFIRYKVLEQLRNGGIISAVQVARSGFKYRYNHSDFYSRFRIIANPFSPSTAELPNHIYSGFSERSADLCRKLWASIIDTNTVHGSCNSSPEAIKDFEQWFLGSVDLLNSDSLQIGRTMVFMRDEAFNFLENRVSRRLFSFVSRIQALFRGVAARLRNSLGLLRMGKCAVVIQGWLRCFHLRQRYRKTLRLIYRLQSLWRGFCARKLYSLIYQNSKAISLQRFMRKISSRRRLIKFKNAVIKIQGRQRLWKAKETARWMRFLREECF